MWTRTTIALAAACCVACSGGGSIDGPTTADLVVVAGGSATDTADARLAQALVVEVRQNGRPQPGVVVTFSGTLAAEPNPAQRRTAWVSDVAFNSFEANAQVTTNSSGRAVALVELGEFAGAAAVVVKCPALNLVDTVDYTVLPSSAARLVMTVDTAVLAGVAYPIDAYVSDRHGNRRDDAVTYSPGPNVVNVDAAGRVTVPNQVVRGAVAVRSGTLMDSARFTVVPDGEVAYLDFTDVGLSAADGVITTSRMDGTRRKTWGKARTPAFPRLSPTDSLIAYARSDLGTSSVFLVDQKGVSRALYDTPGLRSVRHPRFSADGRYVYVSGNPIADPHSIWRWRTDGTDPVRVVTMTDAYRQPPFDVTPDGKFIAYVGDTSIVIHEIATARQTSFGDFAWAMEFSPDGTRLAYTDPSGITIVKLDGSSPAVVGGSRPLAGDQLTWTADGQWLLARDGSGVILVNATSGRTVPVPFGLRFQLSTRR